MKVTGIDFSLFFPSAQTSYSPQRTGLVPRRGLCSHLQKGVLSVLLTGAQEGPGSALSPCSDASPAQRPLKSDQLCFLDS